jgi:selenium donor protein
VATVDFFTPIVDDPYDFGRIAAANALSDIYAMGARPLFALNLIGFPRNLLHTGMLEEIVRGGGEIALQAGIAVIGGHSIDDAEPKFGMCVIGEGHPELLDAEQRRPPGDVLVLTKPIGDRDHRDRGQARVAADDVVRAAVDVMTTLNRGAAEAMLRVGVSAATDVTGFGLPATCATCSAPAGVAAEVERRRRAATARRRRTGRRRLHPRRHEAATSRTWPPTWPGTNPSPTCSVSSSATPRPPAACSSPCPPTAPTHSATRSASNRHPSPPSSAASPTATPGQHPDPRSEPTRAIRARHPLATTAVAR